VNELHEAAAGPRRGDALSPGEQLRAARERAGWSIQQVAAELCLPVERMTALEEDRHASFGGAVFVRGYLRRAAAILGISQDEIIAAYECCQGAARPADVLPSLPPGRLPGRGTPAWAGPLLAMAAVAVAGAGTWWALGPSEEAGRELASSTADESPWTLEFTAPEPEATVQSRESIAPPPVQTAPIALSPADGQVAGTVAESLAAGGLAPAFRLAEPLESTEAPPGTVELRFEFTEDCWLEVDDAEDRRLAYRLYRAGEVTRLRGTAPVSVFLGNVEGVRLSVDGAALALRPASRRDGTARLSVGGGAG
jgi:cytoskeleton protein RodZ